MEQSETFEYASAGVAPKPFVLLTIAEAAAKFERTPRQIRYLCLQGRVPYILGRPPLIDEPDLAQHFEAVRAAELAKIPPAPGARPNLKLCRTKKPKSECFISCE